MSEMIDLEVGRFALRTFMFTKDDLVPLMDHGVKTWVDGTCQAACLRGMFAFMTMTRKHVSHASPDLDCSCGIYGSFSYSDLTEQYHEYAVALTCVMAAEGNTVIGTRGLRTQAARIVAYYFNPDIPVTRVQESGSLASMLYNSMSSTWSWNVPSQLVNKTDSVDCEEILKTSLPGAERYGNLDQMLNRFSLSRHSTYDEDKATRQMLSNVWWTE